MLRCHQNSVGSRYLIDHGCFSPNTSPSSSLTPHTCCFPQPPPSLQVPEASLELDLLDSHLALPLLQIRCIPNTTPCRRRQVHTRENHQTRCVVPLALLATWPLEQGQRWHYRAVLHAHSTQVGRTCCLPNTTQRRSMQLHTSAPCPRLIVRAQQGRTRLHSSRALQEANTTMQERDMPRTRECEQRSPRIGPRGKCRTISRCCRTLQLRQFRDALRPYRCSGRRSQFLPMSVRAMHLPG